MKSSQGGSLQVPSWRRKPHFPTADESEQRRLFTIRLSARPPAALCTRASISPCPLLVPLNPRRLAFSPGGKGLYLSPRPRVCRCVLAGGRGQWGSGGRRTGLSGCSRPSPTDTPVCSTKASAAFKTRARGGSRGLCTRAGCINTIDCQDFPAGCPAAQRLSSPGLSIGPGAAARQGTLSSQLPAHHGMCHKLTPRPSNPSSDPYYRDTFAACMKSTTTLANKSPSNQAPTDIQGVSGMRCWHTAAPRQTPAQHLDGQVSAGILLSS